MAPFSDAAEKLFGFNARYVVAAGACISTFGALNGWILIQGQILLAMAKDNAMPKIFGRLNRRNTPTFGIIITSSLITVLLLANQSKSFSNLYSFMVLLTTVTVLISYLATVMVYTRLVFTKSNGLILNWKSGFMIFLGISFSLWMIVGSGLEAVLWGGVGLILAYLISLDQNKIMITCHSEYGKQKLAFESCNKRFAVQEKINENGRCFFIWKLSISMAHCEYADFQEMVGKSGATFSSEK